MKALVIVDYQNDFIWGALGFEGAEQLAPLIVEKISLARENGDRVIFTLDTHGEDYLESAEGRKLPVPHCIKGTTGHELYGEVAKRMREEDVVIEKPTFGSPQLAEYLKKEGFDEVEFCGLVTDICVVSNVILAKAALPESRIVVDSKATATADIEKYRAALEVMKSVQADVI